MWSWQNISIVHVRGATAIWPLGQNMPVQSVNGHCLGCGYRLAWLVIRGRVESSSARRRLGSYAKPNPQLLGELCDALPRQGRGGDQTSFASPSTKLHNDKNSPSVEGLPSEGDVLVISGNL
jgi:hypothetical protein